MATNLDDLTLAAVAAPHDSTRRKVLADYLDEHDPGAGAVSVALRDDARGPRVLQTVWHEAQARKLEPNYQLLWTVVTFDMDKVVAPTPQPPQPVRRRGADRDVDEQEPGPGRPWLPWADTAPVTPWIRPRGRRVAPLTPGSGRVIPLTADGDEFVEPLTTGGDPSPYERRARDSHRRRQLERIMADAAGS